ncbi:aminoacyl-tRNA hydrolase [Pseudothauera rhizosphaerae]|uniref:Aminoacyl-tRNA hydrolase n=2 Tax=Pseudothauera rhizosphaerae TaxID=2565932 RepID=A0A4S4AY59_9RHOO|nr:aminoacyl-tRNA hydrolase [Pseudothauera rhizosphaerae]
MCVGSTEGRMQIVRSSNGVVFVRDDWKAPLWSIQAPFEFMRDAQAVRKVLVIGTLSDYSLSASKLYPKVARQALEIGQLVVFVGPHALRALKAGTDDPSRQLRAFPSLRDASEYLHSALRPGDLVLLKGSHKTDHLVRLVLDRERRIACWQEKCGRSNFCGVCDQLYAAASAPPVRAGTDRGFAVPPPGREVPDPAGLVVVVGLGNPEPKYADTPHNVGYRICDQLAAGAGGFWEAGPEGQLSLITGNGRTVLLFKPGVSMNRSGEPVRSFLERHGAGVDQLIVVHDDMDLPLGEVRLKREGGDAGHKGVRSVIGSLGSGQFRRIRVGVRRHGEHEEARLLVLVPFAPSERNSLGKGLSRASDMLGEMLWASRPACRGASEGTRTPTPFGT